MAITESQFQTWSNQGATATPQAVRERIERVLTAQESLIQHKNMLNIYLQGSYRNSTNIFGNSDVDVVVQSNRTYYYDDSNLTPWDRAIFQQYFNPTSYHWDQFKSEVVKTLENAFGKSTVKIGNKSIKVNFNNFDADVVPCFQFRKYRQFGDNVQKQIYDEGMQFFTAKDNRPVVNYPKLHYQNGAAKNQLVNGMYKPTVRAFKNMRSRLVDNKKINRTLVPSYFLENLLYNVPDAAFVNNHYSQTVYNILKWLNENQHFISSFVCQNQQISLFGSTPEQWNEENAKEFISQVITLWNEWK